jgi:dienelactone hydrolase
MELLPLEYFDKALDRLEADPSVDRRKVAVMGASKGGEAALIIGSRRKDVRAVIAGVPSNVMWQGFSFKAQVDTSTWSVGGKPTAFVPYDTTKPFISVLDFYQRSRAFEGRYPDAAIPVERIRGPVLLVAGEADQLWPSANMARDIATRLKARRFRYPVTVLTYADAGHAAFGPPAPANTPGLSFMFKLGGTEAGNLAARQQSWDATLALLAKTLK